MRAGLRACSFLYHLLALPPLGDGRGDSLCTISSTLFRAYVLFVALPDMTKPPVDLSEVPGVPCYHLIGVIIVPQRGAGLQAYGRAVWSSGRAAARPSCP